jgi:uncharacterized protein YigE (DUF2233 family)
MDYVDDYCMNMFTYDQALRMYAALNTERVGLLTSAGCDLASIVNSTMNEGNFEISPNPSNGVFTINSSQNSTITPVVYNLIGAEVKRFNGINQFPYTLDLSDLPNGIYYIKNNRSGKSTTKKIIISK